MTNNKCGSLCFLSLVQIQMKYEIFLVEKRTQMMGRYVRRICTIVVGNKLYQNCTRIVLELYSEDLRYEGDVLWR